MIINNTSLIGAVVQAMADNVAGSLATGVILILIILIGAFLFFRIPVELVAILMLPVCMVGAFYFSSLLVFWGLLLLVAIFLIARSLFNI